MSVKPILFTTEMVRAILDGRKTVTRMVVNYKHLRGLENLTAEKIQRACTAPYRPGDVLWVRETWCFYCGVYWHKAGLEVDENGDCKDGFWVNDISEPSGKKWVATKAPDRWRPSIHMPREAARIFLRVTNVRVERLQDISGKDAKKEGIKPIHFDGCIACGAGYPHYPECDYEHCENYQNFYGDWRWIVPFAELWDSTIKAADRKLYGWNANPWVWVIEFERYEKPEEG